MSRLTIKENKKALVIDTSNQFPYSMKKKTVYTRHCDNWDIIDKLSALEDVLEEFGIESAEELRERLKKAIVPKFALNEEVYIIWHNMIVDVRICGVCKNDEYYVDTCHFDLSEQGGLFISPQDIFVTEAEAQAKLDEIRSKNGKRNN